MNDPRLLSRQLAKTLQVVGVACGLGAGDRRCEAGPDALRAANLLGRLQSRGIKAAWADTLRPDATEKDAVRAVAGTCRRLAHRVENIVKHGDLPVVLGGDHSCAIGTWKGVARALAPRGSIGLIWIDAHMDAHTPQTTPSGALHGMPVACLLGHGDPRLTALCGNIALAPEHICLIGVRSFETSESALLKRLGVRVCFMHEVARRGLDAVMREALAIVQRGTVGFGITLDLDVLDPNEAPGVGLPVPGGMRVSELTSSLLQLAYHTALAGVEIAEYNPRRDQQGATAGLIADVLDALLAGQRPLSFSAPLVEMECRYG